MSASGSMSAHCEAIQEQDLVVDVFPIVKRRRRARAIKKLHPDQVVLDYWYPQYEKELAKLVEVYRKPLS